MSLTWLAVWVQPWFGIAAAVAAVSFLIATQAPSLLYPLMAVSNVVFTVVLVRAWFPADVAGADELIHEKPRRSQRPSPTSGPSQK